MKYSPLVKRKSARPILLLILLFCLTVPPGFCVVPSSEDERVSELLYDGVEFSERGDYKKASAAFFSASLLLPPNGNPTTRFLVFNNLGRCQAALNRPVSAYRAYKTALAAVKETDDVEHLLGVTMNLASLCVRIGKPEEALDYAMLASLICRASDRMESVENINTRGVASFMLGQYEEAEKAHRGALEKVTPTRNGLRAKIAENLVADLAAQERYADAFRVLDEAFEEISCGDASLMERVQSLKIKRVYLQIMEGRESDAQAALLEVKVSLNENPLSEGARLLLLAIEAELAKRAGEHVAEAKLRTRMIEVIEDHGGENKTEDLLLFGANAWRYLDVADAWTRAGNPTEAMRWLEIGRRAEEQSMASRSVSLLEDPALVSEIEDCQMLGEASRIAQSRVDWLDGNEMKENSGSSVSNALAIAIQAEKAFEQAKMKLRKANPAYWQALFSDRLNIHPEEMNQIANALPAGVTFVEPVIFRDQVAIFLCSRGNPPICVTTPLDAYGGEKSVQSLVKKAHFMLSNRTPEPRTRKACEELYNILIAPVADQIKSWETDVLLVSPVGYLRYIPFAALFDGEKYLVQDYAVANVTGLDLIRIASSCSKTRKKATFVGFANPDGSLPGAGDECRLVSELFSSANVFQGDRATLNRFLSLSGNATFIHLATHGVLNPNDPSASHLLFANHQKLAYDDMIGLPLLENLQVLTMSACNTASATLGDGAEMSGMAYQFIRKSRAGSVVASQWRVDDGSTKTLMVEFYQKMAENLEYGNPLHRAKSLMAAQRMLLEDRKTRHPFYWAGFVLIGDYR